MKNTRFEDLYYTAPGGERKLKRYVVAALIIGVLMVLTIVWVAIQRTQIKAHMADVPTMTATSTSVSASMATTQISTLIPEVNTCPTDPSMWSLKVDLSNNQYVPIDPPCVYDGLGRTVAWSLAIQMGYSREDANNLLGFSFDPSKNNPAMVVLQNVTILTIDTFNVAKIGLDSTPMTPQFTEWVVTPDGQPAVTDSILGCFRTASMVGNGLKDWGDGYPVICIIADDAQSGYRVNSLSGHLYTGGMIKAHRVLSLFGYATDGRWVWLGNEAGVSVDQSDISQDTLEKGYQAYSEAYQTPIWDSQWLNDTLGIALKPLPDGWLTANNASELQAILNSLNSQ